MASQYKFVEPSIRTYSSQLQECSERHKFELKWKSTTKKENGRDVHMFYPIINDTPYPQYEAVSTSGKQEAKNKAAGSIINSGSLKSLMK